MKFKIRILNATITCDQERGLRSVVLSCAEFAAFVEEVLKSVLFFLTFICQHNNVECKLYYITSLCDI